MITQTVFFKDFFLILSLTNVLDNVNSQPKEKIAYE